jgi:hypothetical protein
VFLNVSEKNGIEGIFAVENYATLSAEKPQQVAENGINGFF